MDTISLLSAFLKMIFALAVVLGLLVVVMYFAKKFMQQAGPAAADSQALINIVSSKYLGPKNRIVVIEVLDQLLVVGISGQQMTTLACIDDPMAIAKIRSGKPDSPTVDFSGNKLARYISRFSLSPNKQKDKTGK